VNEINELFGFYYLDFCLVRANRFSYRRCFKFLRESYRTDGFASWYRGNSANLVRVIPSAAINFTAHEQWKRVLGTDKHE
jgi:solute carrier family 25 protein 42